MCIRDRVKDMNPADAAVLLEELPQQSMPLIFRLLPKELAADAFAYMDGDTQELLIQGFTDKELDEVMGEMFLDDTVAVSYTHLDSTILEAARYAGIDIPTLCYLKDVNQIGACRMCMVEVKGARSLVAACVYPVNEGMEVFTNTPKVQESRRMTLELLLSVHEKKCLSCERSGNCEFQKLCNDMGIEEENRFEGAVPAGNKDFSTPYLERNNAKCILCRRCVAACQSQHVSVIGANNRGFDTEIGCAFEKPRCV